MAVDQTRVAMGLASELSQASDQFMGALEKMLNLKKRVEDSGITFTAPTIEDALAASSLNHLDGNLLNSVLSSAAAVNTFMVDNFHDDNFQKARP